MAAISMKLKTIKARILKIGGMRVFRMKTIYGKLALTALLAIYITGVCGVSFGETLEQDFHDIKGHWSEKAVESLIDRHIVNGAPVGGILEAMPDKNISRAEFVSIIARAFDLKADASNVKSFKDDKKGAWYMDSLIKATSNSLIIGYPDGGFHPDDPLTNGQISIILTRLRNKQIKDSGKTGTADESWYVANVLADLRDEFTKMPANSFIPLNNASRAETFTALYSFIKATGKAGDNAESNASKNGAGSNSQVFTISGVNNINDLSLNPAPGAAASPAGPDANGAAAKPEAAAPGIIGYDISGTRGETVYYQVYAYLLKELGGFDFKITYDPKVVVAASVRSGSIKSGDYLKADDVDLSKAGEGVVYLRNHDISEVQTSDGTLFTLVFRVQPDASGSTGIELQSSNGSEPVLYKPDGSVISPVTCTEGKITVEE